MSWFSAKDRQAIIAFLQNKFGINVDERTLAMCEAQAARIADRLHSKEDIKTGGEAIDAVNSDEVRKQLRPVAEYIATKSNTYLA
jgi:hypothetical protein